MSITLLMKKIIFSKVDRHEDSGSDSDSGRAPGPTTARADMLEEIPSNLPP